MCGAHSLRLAQPLLSLLALLLSGLSAGPVGYLVASYHVPIASLAEHVQGRSQLRRVESDGCHIGSQVSSECHQRLSLTGLPVLELYEVSPVLWTPF